MINDFPIYELKIDETESFVEAIALVEKPAIQSDFIAFSQEQKNMTFSMDDSKMELIGAAMIPDMKIYRRNQTGEEYYVYFKKETIRQIAQVFSRKGFQSNLNIEHSATPAHSFVFQSYIVDEDKGMYSPKHLNVPDGSWVIGVKVTDPNVWNDVKEGRVKGFSVEGIFDVFKIGFSNEYTNDLKECLELLKELNSLIFKK